MGERIPTASASGTWGFHGTAYGKKFPVSTDAIYDRMQRQGRRDWLFLLLGAALGTVLDQLITLLESI